MKVGSTATVSGTVYCSYPILPFGIVACTFFSHNLSRNSCIPTFERPTAGWIPRPSAWGRVGALPVDPNRLLPF